LSDRVEKTSAISYPPITKLAQLMPQEPQHCNPCKWLNVTTAL